MTKLISSGVWILPANRVGLGHVEPALGPDRVLEHRVGRGLDERRAERLDGSLRLVERGQDLFKPIRLRGAGGEDEAAGNAKGGGERSPCRASMDHRSLTPSFPSVGRPPPGPNGVNDVNSVQEERQARPRPAPRDGAAGPLL